MLLHTEACTHSTQKLCTHRKNRNFTFTSVFGDRPSFRAKYGLQIEPHFVRKGCAGRLELALFPQFLTIEPRFVRTGCAGHLEIALLPQFLPIEPRFVRKGRAGQLGNRNFTSVFGDRTSFRAKGLRFVPSRWHCPCPRLQKRNRKEGESKRARGEDVKM